MGFKEWFDDKFGGGGSESSASSSAYDIDYEQLDRNDSYSPYQNTKESGQAYKQYQQAYSQYQQAQRNQNEYAGWQTDDMSTANARAATESARQASESAYQNWQKTVNPLVPNTPSYTPTYQNTRNPFAAYDPAEWQISQAEGARNSPTDYLTGAERAAEASRASNPNAGSRGSIIDRFRKDAETLESMYYNPVKEPQFNLGEMLKSGRNLLFPERTDEQKAARAELDQAKFDLAHSGGSNRAAAQERLDKAQAAYDDVTKKLEKEAVTAVDNGTTGTNPKLQELYDSMSPFRRALRRFELATEGGLQLGALATFVTTPLTAATSALQKLAGDIPTALDIPLAARFAYQVANGKANPVKEGVGVESFTQKQWDELPDNAKYQLSTIYKITNLDEFNQALKVANDLVRSNDVYKEGMSNLRDEYLFDEKIKAFHDYSQRMVDEAGYGLNKFEQFAIKLIPSGIDMAVDSVFNNWSGLAHAGLGLMADRIFGETYYDDRLAGHDHKHASAHALASAVVEVTSELIGGESVMDTLAYGNKGVFTEGIDAAIAKIGNPLMQAAAKYAAGTGSEILEEEFSQVVSPFVDALLEESPYLQTVIEKYGEQRAQEYVEAALGAILLTGVGNATGDIATSVANRVGEARGKYEAPNIDGTTTEENPNGKKAYSQTMQQVANINRNRNMDQNALIQSIYGRAKEAGASDEQAKAVANDVYDMKGKAGKDIYNEFVKFNDGTKTREEIDAAIEAFKPELLEAEEGYVVLDADNKPVGTVKTVNDYGVTIQFNDGTTESAILNGVGSGGMLDPNSRLAKVLGDNGTVVDAETADIYSRNAEQERKAQVKAGEEMQDRGEKAQPQAAPQPPKADTPAPHKAPTPAKAQPAQQQTTQEQNPQQEAPKQEAPTGPQFQNQDVYDNNKYEVEQSANGYYVKQPDGGLVGPFETYEQAMGMVSQFSQQNPTPQTQETQEAETPVQTQEESQPEATQEQEAPPSRSPLTDSGTEANTVTENNGAPSKAEQYFADNPKKTTYQTTYKKAGVKIKKNADGTFTVSMASPKKNGQGWTKGVSVIGTVNSISEANQLVADEYSKKSAPKALTDSATGTPVELPQNASQSVSQEEGNSVLPNEQNASEVQNEELNSKSEAEAEGQPQNPTKSEDYRYKEDINGEKVTLSGGTVSAETVQDALMGKTVSEGAANYEGTLSEKQVAKLSPVQVIQRLQNYAKKARTSIKGLLKHITSDESGEALIGREAHTKQLIESSVGETRGMNAQGEYEDEVDVVGGEDDTRKERPKRSVEEAQEEVNDINRSNLMTIGDSIRDAMKAANIGRYRSGIDGICDWILDKGRQRKGDAPTQAEYEAFRDLVKKMLNDEYHRQNNYKKDKKGNLVDINWKKFNTAKVLDLIDTALAGEADVDALNDADFTEINALLERAAKIRIGYGETKNSRLGDVYSGYMDLRSILEGDEAFQEDLNSEIYDGTNLTAGEKWITDEDGNEIKVSDEEGWRENSKEQDRRFGWYDRGDATEGMTQAERDEYEESYWAQNGERDVANMWQQKSEQTGKGNSVVEEYLPSTSPRLSKKPGVDLPTSISGVTITQEANELSNAAIELISKKLREMGDLQQAINRNAQDIADIKANPSGNAVVDNAKIKQHERMIETLQKRLAPYTEWAEKIEGQYTINDLLNDSFLTEAEKEAFKAQLDKDARFGRIDLQTIALNNRIDSTTYYLQVGDGMFRQLLDTKTNTQLKAIVEQHEQNIKNLQRRIADNKEYVKSLNPINKALIDKYNKAIEAAENRLAREQEWLKKATGKAGSYTLNDYFADPFIRQYYADEVKGIDTETKENGVAVFGNYKFNGLRNAKSWDFANDLIKDIKKGVLSGELSEHGFNSRGEAGRSLNGERLGLGETTIAEASDYDSADRVRAGELAIGAQAQGTERTNALLNRGGTQTSGTGVQTSGAAVAGNPQSMRTENGRQNNVGVSGQSSDAQSTRNPFSGRDNRTVFKDVSDAWSKSNGNIEDVTRDLISKGYSVTTYRDGKTIVITDKPQIRAYADEAERAAQNTQPIRYKQDLDQYSDESFDALINDTSYEEASAINGQNYDQYDLNSELGAEQASETETLNNMSGRGVDTTAAPIENFQNAERASENAAMEDLSGTGVDTERTPIDYFQSQEQASESDLIREQSRNDLTGSEDTNFESPYEAEQRTEQEAMDSLYENMDGRKLTSPKRTANDYYGSAYARVQETQKKHKRNKARSSFSIAELYYKTYGETNDSIRNFKRLQRLDSNVDSLLDGKMSYYDFNSFAKNMSSRQGIGQILNDDIQSELDRVVALEEAAQDKNASEQDVADFQYAAANVVSHIVARMDMVEKTERARARLDTAAKKHGAKGGRKNLVGTALDAWNRYQITGDNFWRMMDDWTGKGQGYSYAREHLKTIATRISEEAKLKGYFEGIDKNSKEFKDFASGTTMSDVDFNGHKISLMEGIKFVKTVDTLRMFASENGRPSWQRVAALGGFTFEGKNGKPIFVDIQGSYDNNAEARAKWVEQRYNQLKQEIANNKAASAYMSAVEEMYYEASKDAERVHSKVNGYDRYMYGKGWYTDIHYANKNSGTVDFRYSDRDATDVHDTASMQKRSKVAGGYAIINPMSRSVDAYISQISNYIAFEEFGQKLGVLSDSKSINGSYANTIRDAYGDQYAQWFDNYVKTMTLYKDHKPKGGMNSALAKARQAMMSGALIGSVSVPIKQVSSFFDTMGTLDPRAVAAVFVQNPLGRKQKGIKNYLMDSRNQSISDPDLAELFGDKGILRKIKDTRIGKLAISATNMMDATAVSNVYRACVLDVEYNNPLGKGIYNNGKNFKDGLTPDGQFYVDAKFEEALLGSQPIFTPQARNELARTDNQFARMFSTFRTQQTQNYNRMLQTWNEYQAARKNDGDTKETGKKFVQTMTGQMIASASLSALTAIANAVLHKHKRYKDDDDELDEEKFWQRFGLGAFESLMGNSLFVGDITKWAIDLYNSQNDPNWNWKYSTKESQYFDAIEGMHIPIPASGAIGTAIQALNSAINLYRDVDENGWSDQNKLSARYLAGNIATAFGVQLNNVYYALNAGYQWYMDAAQLVTGNKKYEQKYDDIFTQMVKVDYSQQNRLVNSILAGKTQKVADMFDDMGQDKFENAVYYGAFDQYKAGKIDKAEYVELLMNFAGKSYKEASNEVEKKSRLLDSGISQYNGIDGRDGRKAFYDQYSGNFQSRDAYKQFFEDVKNGKAEGKHNTYYTQWYGQPQEVSANQSSIIDTMNRNIQAGNFSYDTAKLLWENYYGYSTGKYSAWKFVGK